MNCIKLGYNLAQRTASFIKCSGKSNVLQAKTSVFHGVNPELTYLPTGKSFALPRFISEEMKQARQMNKIAIRQVKHPVSTTFSKATPEDLKRLTSETLEDVRSRVQWTNPKDGKVYNLLKQGETKDGNIIIRILDNDGAFIKDAEIKPKTITIVDSFSFGDNVHIPHGKMVQAHALRNNPFAKYQFEELKIKNGHSFEESELKEILKRALNGKQDYLSLSLAHPEFCKQRIPYDIIKFELEKFLTMPQNRESKEIVETLNKFTKKGTRVLTGAGNSGSGVLSLYSGGQIEKVGALAHDGKIAQFSSSRNSGFTQHYEAGVFNTKEVRANGNVIGYNVTGTTGVDIPVKEVDDILNKIQSDVKQLVDKKESLLREKEEITQKLKDLNETIGKERLAPQPANEDFFSWCDKVDSKYKEIKQKLETKETELHFASWRMDSDIENLKKAGVNDVIFPVEWGTSYSTPARTAKLALNDMMEGVL